MSVADKARAINYFTQASIINATGALERVHQTVFEIPVELAQSMGYSAQKAEMIRSTHKRVLANLHGGVRKACDQLGGLFVEQVGEIETLVNELSAMRWQEKAAKAKAAESRLAEQAALASKPVRARADKPARPAAMKKTPRKKTSKKKGAA